MAYYIEFIGGFLSYIGFIGNIGALHPSGFLHSNPAPGRAKTRTGAR